MNEEKDSSFVYCTPFLDEITRIRNACGFDRFKEPYPESPMEASKSEAFLRLLAKNESIGVTHATFENSRTDVPELVKQNNYTLILDEVIDGVALYNELQSVEAGDAYKIKRNDIPYMKMRNIITVDENDRVTWKENAPDNDFCYEQIKKYADLGQLYCVGNESFIVVIPPEIFRSFSQVYILTYLFEGSLLKYYFDLFGLTYEKKSIVNENGQYKLIDYSPDADADFRNKTSGLIEMHHSRKSYSKYSLSSSWYNRADRIKFKELSAILHNYYCNVLKRIDPQLTSKYVMWTCPKDYKDKIKGKGYTCIRKLTKEERKLPKKEIEEIEKTLAGFVPSNARATNRFIERSTLAYCCNVYLNPLIRRFFTDRGITPDDNCIALSSLIQWVFRSSIRKNEKIHLLILSERMEKLFQNWLANN